MYNIHYFYIYLKKLNKNKKQSKNNKHERKTNENRK